MTKRFSASSAGQMMACPASANLDLAIPNWVEPVRDEAMGAKATGSSVHKMVEDLMNLEYVTPTRTTKFSARDLMHVAQMLTYISELWSTRRFTVLNEATVKATWLVSQPNTTADIVFYTQDEIHVIDMKWGKVEVDVVDNEQLLFYAVCYAPLAPKAKGVTVHILQPRAGNLNSWFIDTPRLKKFMDEAIATEVMIAAGDVTFGPSHHCTFCPANPHSRGDKGKPLCPAMMDLLYPRYIDEDEILNS